jgi:hypothetical protein
MQQAKGAVESALPNNQRAVPIRATKMNVAPQRLFVDFLFVDKSGQIDSAFVMAGLVPTIHVFVFHEVLRRGCPRQARA